MGSTTRHLLHGALAGAAGTTALNATTYLDMVVRGRPASSTPEQTVERGAELAGVHLPEEEQKRQSVESGIGSLLGAAAGVGAGVGLAALQAVTGRPRGAASTVAVSWLLAMAAGNGPMTVLGVTDPRSWRPADWAADVVPHLAYAVVAATALRHFTRAD